VDKDTKVKVEEAVGKLRKAMEGDDKEEIRRLSEELTNASHKLAEAMYQQASQAESQKAGGPGGAKASKPEDDVVDADFEEVKDDKK
jgi:molecular chaperone DnaK